VSLGLPLVRVEALAAQEEQEAVLLGTASLLLIVTSLALLLNRALTRPVRVLAAVMERAESGDLSARMPEGRGDEVGQLARGLNRLLKRVASFQAELEQRVAEATAELRRVNQRLFAAQQRVARTERLAAAGELAAAMAHDVGTPLTAVSAHLQLLAEQAGDAPVRERLRAVEGQVDRAVAAARRFLDAARPAAQLAPVDLDGLLADLLVLIQPEAERRQVSVRPSLPEALPGVSGDPDQLQELFLNLLTNALESTPAGGTLTLCAEAARGPGGGRLVRVTLQDPGPGMSAEVLARAFEPFFTTRAAAGGTGLGLAICRRIAERHGGRIRLESAPGQGTRAVVELPAQER
jgi:signal transduction histidine kinase